MPKQSPTRKSRLNSTTATQRGRSGNPSILEIPLNWLKSGIAVLLLPFCFVATQSFLSAFSQTSASTMVIGSAALWFFFIGILLWLIVFFGLPRPLFIYVNTALYFDAIFLRVCEVAMRSSLKCENFTAATACRIPTWRGQCEIEWRWRLREPCAKGAPAR